MDLAIAGKRALVTGSSRGIGHAIAMRFALEGVTPILVAKDMAALDTAAASILQATGVVPEKIAADLGSADGRQQLVAAAGPVDFLVNNAGAIPGGDLAAVGDAEWRKAWELKVYGTIDLVRHYLPAMQASQGGVIVNVIGMAGVANRANYVCGSVANAALIAFTQSVGSASPSHGVRVLGLNPSPTRTARTEKKFADPSARLAYESTLPFGRFAEASEVANLIVFMCSPLAGYVSGTVINHDGGLLYR